VCQDLSVYEFQPLKGFENSQIRRFVELRAAPNPGARLLRKVIRRIAMLWDRYR